MTTCEDMTFERLLAHLDEPTSDQALLQHVALCGRCSARVLALRVQSLALAALGREHWGCSLDPDTETDEFGYGTDSPELAPQLASELASVLANDEEHPDPDAARDRDDRADLGPSACLGAVRDAGLTSFHHGLRELFSACLWGDPRRARQLGEKTRPRRIGEIAQDLTSLAVRLNSLGLTVTADDLPMVMPSAPQVPDTAGLVLDRIVSLEGPSSWVARARKTLQDS